MGYTWIFDPSPKRQILDSSELRDFADDNFKLDENGGEFFKGVENTEGKGEIACYKQFLLFSHSVIEILALQTRENKGLFGKGLTSI